MRNTLRFSWRTALVLVGRLLTVFLCNVPPAAVNILLPCRGLFLPDIQVRNQLHRYMFLDAGCSSRCLLVEY